MRCRSVDEWLLPTHSQCQLLSHQPVVLEALTTANNVNILMDRKNDETLCYVACHVTATLQILREVNKFLLAYAISFKRVNSRHYFVCLCERILILQLLQRINVKFNFANISVFPLLSHSDIKVPIRRAWLPPSRHHYQRRCCYCHDVITAC